MTSCPHEKPFLLSNFLRKTFQQIFYFMFVSVFSMFVDGEVQLCQSVQPPIQGNKSDNCSLVCSLKFQHAVSSIASDEVTLCVKNTSLAVFCASHNDCRQYHIGAYCKLIPCLCRAKSSHPEAFIFDPFYGVHKINTCVVSKYMTSDQPIVPFPWKTLLIVCAIVLLFAAFLICLRWISPFIRSIHAKRSSRNNPQQQSSAPEDNASLCPQSSELTDATPFTYYFPQGAPRIYRASPHRSQRGHRSSSRARYAGAEAVATATRTLTLANEDKPPPYETAIQLPPPAYEEVQRAIRESSLPATLPLMTSRQQVEVHAPAESTASTSTSPSLPSN